MCRLLLLSLLALLWQPVALRAAKDGAHAAKHQGRKHAASWRDRVLGSRHRRHQEKLLESTDGKCHFLLDAFDDTFEEVLNTTRWDGDSVDGLFHCNRGTNAECTMATAANLLLNTSLPFYPNGNVSGAVLLLSQDPCNNPFQKHLCCGLDRHMKAANAVVCANWTGAHLVSRGCMLYGRLTIELAMKMPKGTAAFFDAGGYVSGGSPDPTWNELDMIWRTSTVQESSVNASAPNGSSFVATNFDATFFNPREHKSVFSPDSWPRYTGYEAHSYHNYSVFWTSEYMTWSLDDVVFRNQTRRSHCWSRRCFGMPSITLIPWRPMTIRLILRTADGTATAQPDSHVFLRRVAYTPLPKRERVAVSVVGLLEFLLHACVAVLLLYCLLQLGRCLVQVCDEESVRADRELAARRALSVGVGASKGDVSIYAPRSGEEETPLLEPHIGAQAPRGFARRPTDGPPEFARFQVDGGASVAGASAGASAPHRGAAERRRQPDGGQQPGDATRFNQL